MFNILIFVKKVNITITLFSVKVNKHAKITIFQESSEADIVKNNSFQKHSLFISGQPRQYCRICVFTLTLVE